LVARVRNRSPGNERRAGGLGGVAADSRIVTLERPGASDKGSPGADRCDKVGHAPFALLPDFLAGSGFMRRDRAGIAELVRAEGSELADQFLRPDLDLLEVLSRDLARTGRAHLGHENDIGPKGLQNPSALDRVSFRHAG